MRPPAAKFSPPPAVLGALLVAAALYLYAPAWRIGYIADDFAWMSLRYRVHTLPELLDELATPRAQGTLRILSDRLFFLSGVERPLAFLTLMLAVFRLHTALARLAPGRVAPAVLTFWWLAAPTLGAAVVWLSAYNQVLGAWLTVEFYLALREGPPWRLAVVYAALLATHEAFAVAAPAALAYAVLVRPELRRAALGLTVAGGLFTLLWFRFVRIVTDQTYTIETGPRVAADALQYLRLQFGLDRLLIEPQPWDARSILALGAAAILVAILARGREAAALGVWAALAIAPFLLVPRNLQNYYGAAASVPLVLFLSTLRGRSAARWALLALLAWSAAQSLPRTRAQMGWYRQQSDRIEAMLASLRQARPSETVVITHIDPLLAAFSLRQIPAGTILPGNLRAAAPAAAHGPFPAAPPIAPEELERLRAGGRAVERRFDDTSRPPFAP